MDELDKLKNHWKKTENDFPQVSENEIFAMLHKKSSSAVKWILIISILEFIFWGLISLSNSIFNLADYTKLPKFITIMDTINYIVIISFIVLFYINYRKISTKRPVKDLLDNIITVRRIVTAYMVYNVFIFFVSMLCGLFIYEAEDYYNDTVKIVTIVISVILILVFVGIIALLYNLLYGRLIRTLNKNYKELQKISGL